MSENYEARVKSVRAGSKCSETHRGWWDVIWKPGGQPDGFWPLRSVYRGTDGKQSESEAWQSAFESLPEWERAKAIVLEKWPDAFIHNHGDNPVGFYVVWANTGRQKIDDGSTEQEAWLDARRRMERNDPHIP